MRAVHCLQRVRRMRLVLVLLIFTFACDHTETSQDVRERYLDRHVETFTFKDRARLLEALRGATTEYGFELVATDSPTHFVTKPKPDSHDSTDELSINVIELLDRSMLLQIMHISRAKDGHVIYTYRHDELEWLVAQRAEPDRALTLVRKANDRADKVPPKTRKQ